MSRAKPAGLSLPRLERRFAELEACTSPSARELRDLAEHANALSELGFAERGRALIARWRRRGTRQRALDIAEAIFTLSIDPVLASVPLRELALRDATTARLFVIQCVLRGELRLAVNAARRHRYFPEETDALGRSYALWALLLLEEYDEAGEVVARLERRAKTPAARLAWLRAEATVRSYRCQYAKEERALEEAIALSREHGLDRAYLELSLSVSLMRSGAIAEAARRMARMPKPSAGSLSALDAYREMARMDFAVLSGKSSSAERHARRALEYAERSGNRMLACHLWFCRALSSDARGFMPALGTFRRETERFQVPYYLSRLRVLDALRARGHAALRGLELVEHSAHEERRFPLARLWTPELTSVGAELYFDAVQKLAHVRGEGPYSLGDHPMLEKTLETLLRTPERELALGELFEAVWQMRFDPLRHESKCHVTLHRLRNWLRKRGANPELLVTQDGRVGFDSRFDVRFVTLPDAGELEDVAPSISHRVEACLLAESPLTPALLESRVGASRAALVDALRELVRARRVRRLGAGPHVRYAALSAGGSNDIETRRR